MAPVWFSVLVVCAELVIAGQTRLWDRDEARYAQATAEMIASGDYLVPTFNGEPRLHKPPLIYWLMSLAVRAVGPREEAFRFFSCLALGGTCLLTYQIGRRLLSREAGLWAMAILASSAMPIYLGAAATTDSVLLFLTTAQMAIFLRLRSLGNRARDVILLGLAMGGSFLTKGPAGLLPAMVMFAVMASDRRATGVRRAVPGVGLGLAIGAAIFLAWAIPANHATGGALLRVGLGFHVFERSLKPLEGHGGGIAAFLFYYPVVVLVGCVPWAGALPAAISSVVGGRVGDAEFRRIVVCWAVVPVAAMACVQTKLPHYIAPVMPALALAVGGALARWRQSAPDARDARWLWPVLRADLVVTMGAGLALIIVPPYLGVPGLWAPSAVAGAIAMLGAGAFFLRFKSGVGRLALGTLVGTILFLVPVVFGVMPALDAIKLGPALGEDVRALAGRGENVAFIGQQEPTSHFYAGRRIDVLETAAEVQEWLRRNPGGLLVVSRGTKDLLEKITGPLAADTVSSRRGFNYSKGEWSDGLVLRARP